MLLTEHTSFWTKKFEKVFKVWPLLSWKMHCPPPSGGINIDGVLHVDGVLQKCWQSTLTLKFAKTSHCIVFDSFLTCIGFQIYGNINTVLPYYGIYHIVIPYYGIYHIHHLNLIVIAYIYMTHRSMFVATVIFT